MTRWAPIGGPHDLRLVWPRLQQLSCLAAFVLLWIGADWPIHDTAEGSMYSMHMVQHFMFTQIAAPLLLIGTPGWFLTRLIRQLHIEHVMQRMIRFFPALVLHSFMVALSHVPWFIDASLKYGLFHFGAHVLLLDDVLYTGRTIRAVINELFDHGRPAQVSHSWAGKIVAQRWSISISAMAMI